MLFRIAGRFISAGMIFLAVCCNGTAAAEAPPGQLPLWEIGLGGAALSAPAYRGSETREFYALPMPYLVYRGDFLKVDREGLRGRLYDSPRVRVELSAAGAAPSSREEDTVREGMPDLDPVGEIGPSINYLLHESGDTRVRLRLPVRVVFASDLTYLEHVGWKTHPQINADWANVWGQWNIGAVFGPIFADAGYHAYYYEVPRRYATDARPAYKAGGGYSGTSLLVSASRRFPDMWLGMYVRYDNLAGAAFSDSPLVETRHAFSGGIGVAWILDKSDRTVPAVP